MRVRSDVDAKAFSKRIFGIVLMVAMSGGPLATPLLAQVVNATPPAPASQVAPVSPASTVQPEATVGAAAQPPGTQITKTVTTTVTNAPAGSAPVHTDLPTNLSVQGMLMAADPIVKVVMALLALASVATWSICLYKIIELLLASSKARSAMRILHAARSLRQATASLPNGAVARLVTSAETEMELSNLLPADGVKERVGIALERVENAESRRIGIGTSILASVGSTGPFVGLFGTVWGIMNSFIHISNAHTTNLSVVAPGIAEALLATAMGLVAAIPAVLIYNTFSRWIGGYRSLLGDCSAAIMRHVSRHLDQRDFDTDTRLAAE